jgi:CBS domain-containing protein
MNSATEDGMTIAHVAEMDVPTVTPQDDMLTAARRLLECRCGILPVVREDERGARVVGLLRYRDAVSVMYGSGDCGDATPVEVAMSPAVCTCRASDSLGVALRLLRKDGIDAVPVLDGDGYLVGLVFVRRCRACRRRCDAAALGIGAGRLRRRNGRG